MKGRLIKKLKLIQDEFSLMNYSISRRVDISNLEDKSKLEFDLDEFDTVVSLVEIHNVKEEFKKNFKEYYITHV